MRITRNTVATFDYAVKNEKGELVDTSLEYGPLSYLHGRGALVPGLESALEGKSPGDSFSVNIPPNRGYGTRDHSLIHVFTRQELSGLQNLKVGTQLQAEGPNGKRILNVTSIEGDKVTLDENHPLAGQTVSFDINVLNVREPTHEELESGQAYNAACRSDCNSCPDSQTDSSHSCGHHGTEHGCGCNHHH